MSHVLFFLAYLYSAGTQHGNLHAAGCPLLFWGPTQEPSLATANTEEIGRGFGKMLRRVRIRKEEVPGSKRSMYGYILIYSRL